MTSEQRTLETRTAKLTLGHDGILRAVATPVEQQTLEDAQENTRAGVELCGGQPCPMLVDNRQIRSYTKEARSYYTSDEGSKGLLAVALLVDSAVGRVLGNFFLTATKGRLPVKLFASEQEAIAWLKGFLP